MNMNFIRIFFLFICTLLATAYAATLNYAIDSVSILLIGAISGAVFGLVLIGIDQLLKNYNLRSFNIALIGLFLGYLMGEVITLLLGNVINLPFWIQHPERLALIKMGIYLSCVYFGMSMTVRYSDNLLESIPFFKGGKSATGNKKKDILVDPSILTDSRLLDLASSGLLDNHLIMPSVILNELQTMAETGDEQAKTKARRSLESYKKLESFPHLHIRVIDQDFPEIPDAMTKLIKLARFCDADILTADLTRIQQSLVDGVRFINIHIVLNALKPVTQAGEHLNIKIQRYGKEPRQGVGYLEDGTMVVVNGGAEYIGETIKAQVLSVKHTTSGRMIFCNSSEEAFATDQELPQMTVTDLDNDQKSYFVAQ